MRIPLMSWDGQRPLRGSRAMFLRVNWTRIDWTVLALAVLLLGIGMVFLNAMAEMDARHLRTGISFQGHVKKVVVALPFLAIGVFLRPRWLRSNAWWIYGLTIALLVLVAAVGDERNNARRWIELPMGFDLQPSELAKVGLILVLARALYRNRLQSLGDWALPGVLAGLPIALVALQPDLGTALLIAPLTAGMFYLAGASARTILGLGLAVALLLGSAWQLELVEDYQRRRIDTWISSFDDVELVANKNGAAFHTYHNRVCVGNGGWRGRGLGKGIANQAGHLPERESDSVFAVVAEEGGLVGAGWLTAVYLLMIAMILRSAGRIRERFSRLVVGGVAIFFASHFFLHTGVTLGLLPMTGLTLPLLSTGGSSLLASFLALGLAIGLGTHHEPTLDSDAFKL